MPMSPRAIRNIFIYLTPKILTYGLNLIILPVLTRLLTPQDFGIVALAWLFPNVAAALLMGGLPFAVPRYYFEYRHDERRLGALIFSSQVFLGVMFILSGVLVFAFRTPIAALTIGDVAYARAVPIAFMAIYLEQVMTLYQRLYQNMELAARHSTVTIAKAVIQSVASLALVAWAGVGYMGPIYGAFLGSALAVLYLTWDFGRRFLPGFRRSDLVDNIRYGLQVVPKTLSGTVTRFFDKYLLQDVASMSTVGVYAIGQQLSGTLNYLISTVWMSFQPEAMRAMFDQREAAAEEVGRLFTVFVYLCVLPVAVVVLFAEQVIAVVAPASYDAAVDVFAVLCASTVAQVFLVFVGLAFAYSGRPAFLTSMTFVSAGFNVAANLLLVRPFGVIGAASASVATQFFLATVLGVAGQRHYRVAYEWRKLLPALGVLVASVVMVLVLRRYDAAALVSYVAKTSMLIVMGGVGVRSGMLSRSSLRSVVSALRRGEESDAEVMAP